MAGSPYASSLGRLQPQFTSFLSRDLYAQLVNARGVEEVVKTLEATPYGPEIVQSAASYRGAVLLELAINRTFVFRNRQGINATPFAGKPTVGAYLRKWDIENLTLILSAKAQGRTVQETEAFLVSSRDIPAGLFAGDMTLDDFRVVLQQPTLEAVVQSLVKFGYGAVLLPLLDAYQRSKDIFPLLQALDRYYYASLLESSRYFQGDEWVVRSFVRSELDQRNVLLLLKGKEAELPLDVVAPRFLDGGDLPRSTFEELFGARTVPELVTNLESRYPSLRSGDPAFAESRSLTGYESALQHDRAVRELKRLRSYPLSICVIFAYLLLSELERADLRRIVYGKLYGVSPRTLESMLVVPKL